MHLVGILFTAMQTLLFVTLMLVYMQVIQRESPFLGRLQPLLIGIAGDSASGKDYLSNLMVDLFRKDSTVVVEGDDYHKWERGDVLWEKYTHLNPKANHLVSLAKHTELLSGGVPVMQAHYDHRTGNFMQPRELIARKTMIVQGLHTLYLRGMRDAFDLKIFLLPEENIRRDWKVKRDSERGYTKEKVIEIMETRKEDSAAHIDPQQQMADWVIKSAHIDAENIEICHSIWNDVSITELVEELSKISSLKIRVELSKNNLDRINLYVSGKINAQEIESISEKVFPNLRQITRSRSKPTWSSDLNGITQLMSLLLLEKSRYN